MEGRKKMNEINPTQVPPSVNQNPNGQSLPDAAGSVIPPRNMGMGGNAIPPRNMGTGGNAIPPYNTAYTASAPPPEPPETQKMKAGFGFFGLGSILYAIFYTFCMYRNASGITYFFFVAGSIFFFCLCMKRLDISVKKGSIFYMAAMLLLGVSTFCTADLRIIAFNKTGVFLLTLSLLLHQFYEDKNWSFGKYLLSILCTIFGSIGQIARPFQDFGNWMRARRKDKKSKAVYIAIGCCISVPLFLLVWFLLITADRVFLNMTERLFDALNLFHVAGMVCMTVFMFFAVYCLLAYLCAKRLNDRYTEKKQAEAAIAVTVALPLTIMYLVFSVVQVVYLFMGKAQFQNMTYAEYARQGFFQLLFICILNLVLVLAGGHYFKESGFLKAVLAVMSMCTYVMIASAAMRMIMYIQHYYLTFLRILVLWALAVLFLLLTGVLASIFFPRFSLFRYGIIVVAVMYTALSFSKPDYWIALCNLQNARENTVHEFFDADAYHDYRYLSRLSADAAPVVLPYLEKAGYDMSLMWDEEVRKYYRSDRGDEKEWGYYYMRDLIRTSSGSSIRQFNVSEYTAVKIMEGYR